MLGYPRKFAVLCAVLIAAGNAPAAFAEDTVRPAVGRLLQQAEGLLQKQDYRSALLKVQQASTIQGLTPHESVVIAQLRGAAAAGAGDYRLAASSYQTVLESDTQPPAVQAELTQAIAGFYYQAGDYPDTEIWTKRYIAAHGKDARTRALLAQAYYESGDFAAADSAAAAEVAAEQQSGQIASEGQLQLMAYSAKKSGDMHGYRMAFEQLLTNYPSQQYWNIAIGTLASMPDFPDYLMLNTYRLRFATGTLTRPQDYEDLVERLVLADNFAEAHAVVIQGFTSGVLTASTDEGHAERLRTLVDQKVAAAPIASDSGVERAQNESDAADSSLDLGIAYLQAGNAQKAIQNFKSVPSYVDAPANNPEAQLARLWCIRAQTGAVDH